MNKRDFLVSGAGAAFATAVGAAETAPASPLETGSTTAGGSLLGRTRRHPDLATPSAARFEAYVGQAFAAGGTTLRLASVTRRPGCAHTEQFSVRFEAAAGPLPLSGAQVVTHVPTGQRLALHLESGARGTEAHFALLA